MSAVSTAARSRRRAQEDGLAREKAVVVDLEAAGSPVAGGGDSRRVAPIPGTPAGTQGSPIDVEALVDGEVHLASCFPSLSLVVLNQLISPLSLCCCLESIN